MTRVFPLPAPARMSTGPPVVSTASRCCGLSWERKDKVEELRAFYLDFTGRPRRALSSPPSPRPVIPSEENRPQRGRSSQSRNLLFACSVEAAGESRFLTAEAVRNDNTI